MRERTVKPFLKFAIVIFIVSVTIGIIFSISSKTFANPTDPERIPSYEEVVPNGFSYGETRRVLDYRDAGPLLQPRLSVVRIADNIIEIACPSKYPSCIVESVTTWVRQNFEHSEVIQTRAYIISPEETILFKEGDDITLAILTGALLRAEGMDVRIGVTPYSSFLEVNQAGTPVRIDMGCANCGLGRIRYQGQEQNIDWIE